MQPRIAKRPAAADDDDLHLAELEASMLKAQAEAADIKAKVLVAELAVLKARVAKKARSTE
jgi:hypothetical protein